jgi:hypothetical protein
LIFSSTIKSSMNHNVRSIRSVTSNSTTPHSSTYPSAYPSEAEDEEPTIIKAHPFPFLSLPSELRNKIYGCAFEAAPPILDLDPDNFRLIHHKFSLFLVSKQIHAEASHHFYSSHTIRLFPTHPGRFFKTRKPLLARLSPQYRSSITSLELRLGPGWNKPPRGWVINDALGLQNTTSVRVLKVFVECDPSDGIFKGFRQADGFYESFSKDLLNKVLEAVPSIEVVEFDAWTSVKKNGDMMMGLLEVATRFEKMVAWGPERGWNEEREEDMGWVREVLPGPGTDKIALRSMAVLS